MLSVIHAECHLCRVSFMLSVANKAFMLSVIMLNVVMLSAVSTWSKPIQGDQKINKKFAQMFEKVAKTVAKAKKAKSSTSNHF